MLAAVYVLMQRRRTKYAVRFTNVDLLANVVSKTPSWRRHVPAVLLLLSTALLIFALARPRVEASTTREQGAIMLATDTSGSMTATDVKPDRMTAARNAAKQFVGKIPKQVRLGLVTFDQAARLLVNPTTDRTQVNDALDSLQAQGGTAMGDALSVSVKALQSAFGPKGLKVKPGQKRAPAEVVLLSDGKNTTGATDPIGVAQTAKKLGIRINTVALGTPTGTVQVQDNLGFTQTIQVPPDRPTLPPDRADHGRAVLQRAKREPSAADLQGPGLEGEGQAGQEGGLLRAGGRGHRAHARRGRLLAALVRAPPLKVPKDRPGRARGYVPPPMTTTNTLRFLAVLAASAGLAASPAVAGAHAAKKRHHHSSIPQHNGGDHDADNRGGPSDGDGNI